MKAEQAVQSVDKPSAMAADEPASARADKAEATEYAALADMFLDQLGHVSLAHHVKGRARLKVNWTGISALLAKGLLPDSENLRRILGQAPGIRSWRVNPKALSVVIEYDEAIWPYRLWEELAGLAAKPQTRPALRRELLAIWAAHAAADGAKGLAKDTGSAGA